MSGVTPLFSLLAMEDQAVIKMVEQGLGVSMMSELVLRGCTSNLTLAPIDPPLEALHTIQPPLEKGELELVTALAGALDDSWTVAVQPHVGRLKPDVVIFSETGGCAVFEVKTEPPRPKGESLAIRTASASSLARNSIDTGPKNSQ